MAAWYRRHMNDRVRLKEVLDRALVVAAAALGAGVVLLRQASYGPSMGPDAVNYVATARNLLAGDGFVDLAGPFVAWPPLYPAMLAGGGLFGFDPYAVAGPLNALIFGLTILVAGWWLRRHMRSRFLWMWGCVSIALAFPLVQLASEAMSDSAFILFVTLSLAQIDAHLDGRGRASLILAAAFSALAFLTRYMGASLILAVVPMLIAARVAPREKMKRIAAYALIAAAPAALWMLRNFLVVGSATGDRSLGFYSFRFIVDEALRIVAGGWWLPGLIVPALLALAMAAGHAILRRADRNKRDAPVASDVAWRPFRVCGGFVLAYLTLLVAAMMSGGTWDGLQWRFLAPAYVPLLFAALLLLDGALRYARRRAPRGIVPRRRGIQAIGWAGALAVVLMSGLSLQATWLLAQHARQMPLWNDGARQWYAEARWSDSESVRHVREAALTGAILSNDQIIASLHIYGPARHYQLPCEPDDLRSALLNPESYDLASARGRQAVAFPRQVPGSGEVHVLYFDEYLERPCSRQQDEILGRALSRDPLLELVAELADGKLYRLREREFWPAAIFHSSGAPVEGRPFGAFLNESHGRQLPGEPWRWEKGDDADGWTSLPARRPADVYTPAAADVGHRLRASLYYEDRLGNRVEAIVEPSAPVRPDILRVVSEPPGSEDGRVELAISEADRASPFKYDVYLYGNRLIYGKQDCAWEDEYGTRFPLTVYSLNSEGGTPERDTLDFEWHRSSLKDNGTCATDRRLPDKDILGIQTGQVDRLGNLLWEAERWFGEKRRWFDEYLSSAVSGEPAARGVFEIHIGGGSLIFVKEPCVRADTEAMFFVHLVPEDATDLPEHRKQYGFDNLDFDFDERGERFDDKCLAIVPLPEYGISEVRTGQYEGDRLWTEEISVTGSVPDE